MEKYLIPRCKTVRKPRAGNAGRENTPTPHLKYNLRNLD
jgi:hypothetical protein